MLDGNAIAGALGDIFGVDMTLVVLTCRGCGARGPLARPPCTCVHRGRGLCRHCDNVLVVVIERGGTCCLDLRGTTDLR